MKLYKYHLFLPKYNKVIIIKARDEATAIWKLLQKYKLRECEVDNYIILRIE